jgi:hypothetical protein
MEQVLDVTLLNWHTISTLQPNEKLYVKQGLLVRHPYSAIQYLERRFYGRCIDDVIQAVTQHWNLTRCLVQLMCESVILNLLRDNSFCECKETELKYYQQRKSDLERLTQAIKDGKNGIRTLNETYKSESKLEQLLKDVDVLLRNMTLKLEELDMAEKKNKKHSINHVSSSPEKFVTYPSFHSTYSKASCSDKEIVLSSVAPVNCGGTSSLTPPHI